MNFNQRLTLAFVAPAVLFVAGLVGSIWSLVQTQHEFDRYLGTEQAVANGVREMYAQGLQMGQALRNVVLDPTNQRAYQNLEAARKAFDEAHAEATRVARGTGIEPGLASLTSLRATQAQAQDKVMQSLKSDPSRAAALLNAEETPAWRELRAELLKLRDVTTEISATTREAVNTSANRARWLSTALAVAAIVSAALLGMMLRRTVRREIGGDPAVARATLDRIAAGDLTGEVPRAQETGSLIDALHAMQSALRELVGQVQHSSASIEVTTREIATGNLDLSARTEQTASNLQETAASLEQLTATVRQGSESARLASQMAVANAEAAARGGEVVSQVVSTMQEINHSSQKIHDIIGVIDGIAFQTNILALNAAVEAARAGEQGRGFAVVAGEVRNLAQRSAEAAKEIKTLIGTSVERVQVGTHQVGQAGATINEVVANAQRVADIIGEITAASGEQSAGIGQVNLAVTHLDQMTQQNAALVEQSAAAAESLKDQAQRLSVLVQVFRVPL